MSMQDKAHSCTVTEVVIRLLVTGKQRAGDFYYIRTPGHSLNMKITTEHHLRIYNSSHTQWPFLGYTGI